MLFYRFVRFTSKIISLFFFSYKVYGEENVPAKGPFILASNHVSYVDPFIIPIACKRRLSFVARDTLFDHRILGWFLRRIGCFPIKRGSSDIRAIKEIFKRLKNDMPVLIFPEGTRHEDKKGKKAEAGVGMIAAKSNVPVIPLRVIGSEKVLPAGSKKIKRGLVKVVYGKPVRFSRADSYQEIADIIMEKVLLLSA